MSFSVPTFPSMATEFSRPVGEIQFLISTFLIGLDLMLGGLFTILGGRSYDHTLWPFIFLAGIAILGNFLAAALTLLPCRYACQTCAHQQNAWRRQGEPLNL